MSKKEKLLLKIKNNPINIRFEVLEKLLISYDFIERQPGGGSSHHIFCKEEYQISIPYKIPMNKIYVKRTIEIIEELEARNI
nr:toxin HicA [uncultured Aminipila sp.]